MIQAIESKNNLMLVSQPEAIHNLRDIHKHLEKTSTVKLSYSRFKIIFLALNGAIMDYILAGYSFKFPYNLGILRVKKRKLTLNNKKMLRVDFAKTNKFGKTIYHLNEHSDGFYYRFSWGRGYVQNIMKYSFVPVRKHKRALAHAILVEHKDYLA